ncbi:unnamed protein product [Orchesella dallaii]
MFQGIRVKLDDLMNESASLVREKIRDEFAHGNIPIVVNTQVPDKLEYYVQRTVTSRNRLKVEVLKHNFEDVFLIDEMARFQLSSFIGSSGTTAPSGNQLKELTARFILLEHKQDFEKIRQLAHARSIHVHWIKYNGKNFELVYSGAVETLKEYIDDEQTSFPENELAFSTENKVIIADSPGMGKTSLLANIAHQIISQDDKMLVRFIVLNEFVKEFTGEKVNVISIVKKIAEQSSVYEFGRKFVEHTLKTGPCALMFDGFDEVHFNQISNAKQILQAAATLPQARIFVATRRNLQDELEKTFQVLGFTIQPFKESNQVEFLLKFWEMKGALSNDSLTNFTKECLKQLTSKMTDSERDIAGIPLQCRLLAEAYEEDAIRCSRVGYHLYEDSNSIALIDSIYEMYERYINMQFQKMFKQRFSFTRYESIKRVHMYHAMKVLFPDHAILLKNLNTSFLTINELCGLGLLEATNSNDIRFVHRTFAEFFIAWFVHENMNTSTIYQEFVLSTIFKTKPFSRSWGMLNATSANETCFEFVFPVICYFVNGFLRNKDLINFTSSHFPEKAMPIYIASAYHNYNYIPNLIISGISYFADNQRAKESEISTLLLTAAALSSVEFMKLLFSNIDITSLQFLKLRRVYDSGSFMITPLHIAVLFRRYSLVEYLIQRFENKLGELRYLAHVCVSNSIFDSDTVLEEKIQIIKLLTENNKACINERLRNGRPPIMQDNISPKLIVSLINAGADLSCIDEMGNTFLHRITYNVTIKPKSLHQIIVALNEEGFQSFNEPNRNNATPLHLIVQEMEILKETLQLFLFNHADLNAVDEENDSVLFYAIRGGRSVEFIKGMIDLGADWKHCNLNKENALHICIKCKNLEVKKYLVETFNMAVKE